MITEQFRLNVKELTYISSNKKKIQEINEYFPHIKTKSGLDFPEVLADYKTVILYKTLLAKDNEIVEDAIISLDGKEIIDIKWQLDNLNKRKKCEWIVSLGVKQNNKIYLYTGKLNGYFEKPNKTYEGDIFAFDTYFTPLGEENNLHELKLKGLKSQFSARVRAIKNIINNECLEIMDISKIKPFKGKWQNDYSFNDFIKSNKDIPDICFKIFEHNQSKIKRKIK